MASIIVVDDDPIMLSYLVDTLGEQQHRVTTAENGSDGLALIEAQHPDLVILDCGLPGISELKILDHLQRSTELRNVPVLILSARQGGIHAAMMSSYGATAVLNKPVTPDQLADAVASSLGSA